MDFAGLQFRCEAGHHVLMLLNAGHTLESCALHGDFVVVLSTRQIENFDFGVGIVLRQALFHLFWCHKFSQISRGGEGEQVSDPV